MLSSNVNQFKFASNVKESEILAPIHGVQRLLLNYKSSDHYLYALLSMKGEYKALNVNIPINCICK